MPNRLYYVHDPMCSWCWGFRPALETLLKGLPPDIEVERLLGGLAPDSQEPMPAAMREQLQQTWRRIQERIPGTRFNFAFWSRCSPRRSTWPACRAAIATRLQDPGFDWAMTDAIQRAYYLDARNPSDPQTLIALAGEIGADATAFARDLDAAETRQTLEQEMAHARRMGVDSLSRPGARLLRKPLARPGGVYGPGGDARDHRSRSVMSRAGRADSHQQVRCRAATMRARPCCSQVSDPEHG